MYNHYCIDIHAESLPVDSDLNQQRQDKVSQEID
jgi:hypothetical protein